MRRTGDMDCTVVQVVMSNWEARRLSARQVAYAALDALVTGQLLRGLRLWHSSPSACPSCRSAIGAPVDARAALGCAPVVLPLEHNDHHWQWTQQQYLRIRQSAWLSV